MNSTGRILTLEEIKGTVVCAQLDSDIIVWNQEKLPTYATRNSPVRVDAMLIALCLRGGCRVSINMSEYDITENTLMVIHPQHFLGVKSMEENTSIRVMACSRGIVEEMLPKLTGLLPLLLHQHAKPITHLLAHEAQHIGEFIEFIHQKLEMPPTPFRRRKVICLLQAAMYEIMDLNSMPEQKIPETRSRREELMARFILAVARHYRNHREVAFYSDALCISPKHLSTIVKAVSGRTPGEWIESHVIMEAKMLLTTTDLSIQEIAALLNFPNQSFFGKYFRHQTGTSPSSFRKTAVQ